MSNICGSSTNGVVPPLPSTLKDTDNMFSGAENFSGDVALSSSLKSAEKMFYKNKKLNVVTGLKNTQITNGNSMFSYARLTDFDGLPETLTDGCYMFYSDITRGTLQEKNISSLPANLTNADFMFYEQSKLSGEVTMPSGLVNCNSMFNETKVTKSGTWTCN